MKFETLKERMEYYKSLCDIRLTPNSYVLVHVDGRAFSKMVKKKFQLPFDDRFISMMNETAAYVCKNIQGCKLAFVQSDEMSFVITDFDTPETDSFFGFRLCKMQSIIASLATGQFNRLFLQNLFDESASSLNMAQQLLEDFTPFQFDCKVWTVPTYNDVFGWIKYRQNDCVRNSKQQAAQTYIPHKDLMGKHTDEQIEILKERKGIDWNTDYDDGKKFGRLIYKEIVTVPIEHGPNKGQTCERSVYKSHFAPMLDKETFESMNLVPKRD